MALVLKDRVKETSTTTGTGAFTLAGAVTGYQSFSAVGDGNTTYYCIAGQTTNEWEVGVGTYTASGTSLSRDTILASSNSNSIVTFSAGTKDVFVVYPAGKSVNQDASGVTTIASLVATTADINGGTIDGTAIGGSTPAAGAFTTLSATGNATLSNSTAEIQFTGATYGWLRATVGDLYVDAPTAKSIFLRNAGSTIANISSTGLSVTGTLSATGAIRGTFFDSAVIYGGADNDNFTAVYGTSHPSLPNQWEVTLDGANRARITTTGLSVTGTLSSTGNFTVNTDRVVLTASAPANSLYLNGSGNLGLGTASPSTKLHLQDNSAVYIQMTDVGDGASRVGQNGTALTFGVDGADGSTERMRIDASGNVGIGTASGSQAINIARGAGLGAGIEIAGNGNTIGSGGVFVGQGNDNFFYLYQRANHPMLFGTNNTERMRIDASGNVGIGTASPGYKLEVNGTANFSTLYEGGRKVVPGSIFAFSYIGSF